jgi:hypothetical protein
MMLPDRIVTCYGPLEVLLSARFILLPVALIRFFGSPHYMNAPFVLWAFVYYGSLLVATVVPTSLPPSVKHLLFGKKNEGTTGDEVSTTNLTSLEYTNVAVIEQPGIEIAAEAQHQSTLSLEGARDGESERLYFSSRSVGITLSCRSVIDIVASLYSVVICVIIAGGLCIESDNKINPGWATEYYLVVTSGSFSVAAILLHIGFFFVAGPCRCACCCDFCRDDTDLKGTLTMSKQLLTRYGRLSICFACFVAVATGFLCFYLDEARVRSTGQKRITYSDCDAMIENSNYCMLPFPSMQYLKSDSTTPTGYIVSIDSDASTPAIKKGGHLNLDFVSRSYDGFSVSGALLWHLSGFVDRTDNAATAMDQLVGEDEVTRSLMWNETAIVINNALEELHPVFCEVDVIAPAEADRICYCQPATAMNFNTEYSVVVKGLKDIDGNILPASSLFGSYTSAYTSGSSEFDSDERFVRFRDNLFPLLERNNVTLHDVQLAWDFHTVSSESSARFARSIRNLTMGTMDAHFGATGDSYVSRVSDGWTSGDTCDPSVDYTNGEYQDMAVNAYYSIKVPWLLEDEAYVGTELLKQFRNRGYNEYQAVSDRLTIGDYKDIDMREVGVLVQVPCSVSIGQVRVNSSVEWGHGIFSDRIESTRRSLQVTANVEGWILWSMEWRGFDRFGFPVLARQLIHDGGLGLVDIYNNAIQGFVAKVAFRNWILPKILLSDAQDLKIDGKVDSADMDYSFMGGSMGSILGAGYVYVAGVEKSVLYTGGSPFTFIIGRSTLFAAFLPFLDLQFYNRIDARVAITWWQLPFDEVESVMLTQPDPVTGSYSRNILVVAALGDSVVCKASTAILSRNINASLVIPSVVDHVDLLSSGDEDRINSFSAHGTRALFLASYPGDEAVVAAAAKQTPSSDESNEVHGCFPADDDTSLISSHFLRTGSVENPCGNRGCIISEYADC